MLVKFEMEKLAAIVGAQGLRPKVLHSKGLLPKGLLPKVNGEIFGLDFKSFAKMEN